MFQYTLELKNKIAIYLPQDIDCLIPSKTSPSKVYISLDSQTQIENKLMVTKGEWQGKDKLGVWEQHIHTIYKIDKQEGPTV